MSEYDPGSLVGSLEAHCEKMNVKLLDFLDRFKKEANFSSKYDFKKTLEKTLDKSFKNKPALTTNNRIYYNWVLFFNIICDVPLNEFEISEYDPIGKILLETGSLKSTSETSIESFQYSDDSRSIEQISNDYKELLLRFVHEFKSDLLIFDYIGRYLNEFDKPQHDAKTKIKEIKDYIELHEQVYRLLEEKIFINTKPYSGKKRDTVYVRTVSLPITGGHIEQVEAEKERLIRLISDNPHEFIDVKKLEEFEIKREIEKVAHIRALKKEIIKISSVPLFKHMVNCLMYDPSFGYEYNHKLLKYQSGIYMVEKPPRFHSYAIMNNKDKFLSEYYQYTKKGEIRLDRLHIASGKSKAHLATVNVYELEINKLTEGYPDSPGVPKFNLDDVEIILQEINNEFPDKDKRSKKEKKMFKNHQQKISYFKEISLT